FRGTTIVDFRDTLFSPTLASQELCSARRRRASPPRGLETMRPLHSAPRRLPFRLLGWLELDCAGHGPGDLLRSRLRSDRFLSSLLLAPVLQDLAVVSVRWRAPGQRCGTARTDLVGGPPSRSSS